MRTRLLIALLLPLCSAAPIEFADKDKDVDIEVDHVHDGMDNQRESKVFTHNQFDLGYIDVSGSVKGHDASIGHQLDVDVHGHGGYVHKHGDHAHGNDGLTHDHHVQGNAQSPIEECLDLCQSNTCQNDRNVREGCNQMFSCAHGCKLMQISLERGVCRDHCDRNGQSGCSPNVGGWKFDLCQDCNRGGCTKWPQVEECKLGCNFYNAGTTTIPTTIPTTTSTYYAKTTPGVRPTTTPTSTSTTATTTPGAWRQKNEADCWNKCGNKEGSCPTFCGSGGFCCRKGHGGCPAGAAEASPKHHTCVIPPGAEVLEVDAQNFQRFVSSYTYMLVLFYNPECPICIRLFPEYDAAAKILAEKQPIGSFTKMSKIDATVHTALRDHYKIPGYPTMKLFYNGQEFGILTGFQEANSIVDWLDSQRGTGGETTTTMAITGGPTTTTTMAITATTTNTNEQNTCVCGQVASDRVVGGKDALNDEFPWMAFLKGPQPLENFEWCGGSLINDRWIVTASHCFNDGRYDAKSPDKLKVILGEHDFDATDDTTWTFDVEKIILHPGYDFAVTTPRSNDIALLKLKSRVDINRFVPVCLPSPYADYTGETATVIGWRDETRWGDSLSSQILQKLEGLQVVNDYDCSEAMKKKIADTLENRITSDMLCAGGEEGKDSCKGNSGLPLLYKNQQNEQNELIGVASWGKQCGAKDAYGVYAETSVFVNWIKNTVQANGGGEYCEH